MSKLKYVAVLLMTIVVSGIGLSFLVPTPTFYLGGIQINEPNQAQWTQALKSANMNTVEVTIYARQGEWDSDSLQVPTMDEGALAEIRSAKKAGLKVALILRVALDHAFKKNRFLWHGMILPTGEEKLDRWFERYQYFVATWAKIAQAEGVDVLGVGSEMNALSSTTSISSIPNRYAYFNNKKLQRSWEKRSLKYKKELQKEDLWVRGYDNYPNLNSYINDRINAHYKWGQMVTFAKQPNRVELMNQRRERILEHWKNLIAHTRTIYDGKLTYAANFDNYMEVNFWQELDFMGINAYFPLRNANKEYKTEEDLADGLKHGWEKVFRQINAFRGRYDLEGKPIIFTELGYIFRENTTIAPWEGFGFMVVGSGAKQRLVVWGKQPINHTERKLAIDALYEVVQEKEINLEGILYWKLTSMEEQLSFEPFGMALSPEGKDPMQASLAKFRAWKEEK